MMYSVATLQPGAARRRPTTISFIHLDTTCFHLSSPRVGKNRIDEGSMRMLEMG